MLSAIVGRFPLLHTAKLGSAKCQSHDISARNRQDRCAILILQAVSQYILKFFYFFQTFFAKPMEISMKVCYNIVLTMEFDSKHPPERI